MESLLTLKPGLKTGIKMRSDLYDAIKKEILNMLSSDDEISPQLFFANLHSQFVSLLGENTGWYVYHVKLDMEATGLITSRPLKGKRATKKIIKLVRKRLRRS